MSWNFRLQIEQERMRRAEQLIGPPVEIRIDPETHDRILFNNRGQELRISERAFVDHPDGTLDELLYATTPYMPQLPPPPRRPLSPWHRGRINYRHTREARPEELRGFRVQLPYGTRICNDTDNYIVIGRERWARVSREVLDDAREGDTLDDLIARTIDQRETERAWAQIRAADLSHWHPIEPLHMPNLNPGPLSAGSIELMRQWLERESALPPIRLNPTRMFLFTSQGVYEMTSREFCEAYQAQFPIQAESRITVHDGEPVPDHVNVDVEAGRALAASLEEYERRLWGGVVNNGFNEPQNWGEGADTPQPKPQLGYDPSICQRCIYEEVDPPRIPTRYFRGQSLCPDHHEVLVFEWEKEQMRAAYRPPKGPRS